MKTVCAWCGAIIKEGTGNPNEPVSHGMCDTCANQPEEERDEMLMRRSARNGVSP